MTGIDISDRAIVRYLERVKGFNLNAIRDEITGIVAKAIGSGARAVSRDGASYILEGEKVVTILHGTKYRRRPK